MFAELSPPPRHPATHPLLVSLPRWRRDHAPCRISCGIATPSRVHTTPQDPQNGDSWEFRSSARMGVLAGKGPGPPSHHLPGGPTGPGTRPSLCTMRYFEPLLDLQPPKMVFPVLQKWLFLKPPHPPPPPHAPTPRTHPLRYTAYPGWDPPTCCISCRIVNPLQGPPPHPVRLPKWGFPGSSKGPAKWGFSPG